MTESNQCFEEQLEKKFDWMLNLFGLPILYFFFVLILAIFLFGWASYPTLEGWGLWATWDERGSGFFFESLLNTVDRPLHLLPSLVIWLLPGSYGTGAMILGGFLALARGLLLISLARVNGLKRGVTWLVFLFGMFQPLWPGCAYERFHAAQVAFIFFLISLLLVFNYDLNRSPSVLFLGWLIQVFGFMTYQGLFLVTIAVPFIYWLCGDKKKVWPLGLMLLPPCFFYVIYYVLSTALFPGSYVEQHAKDSELNFNKILYLKNAIINSGYLPCLTYFFSYLFILVLLPVTRKIEFFIIVSLLFFFAPVSSLIYFKVNDWLSDPDRVMFPIMAWIVVVVLGVGSRLNGLTNFSGLFGSFFLIAFCFCSLFSTYSALLNVRLQQFVLFELQNSQITWTEESNVLIKDSTGELGGFYSFYAPINNITRAWQALGRPGKITICADTLVIPNLKAKIKNKSIRSKLCDDCDTCGFTNIFIFEQTNYLFYFIPVWKINLLTGPQPQPCFEWSHGFWPVETDGTHHWRWGAAKAELKVNFQNNRPGELRIKGEVLTASPRGEATLRIWGGDWEKRFTLSGQWRQIDFNIPIPVGTSSLNWSCDADPIEVPGRTVVFSIRDFRVHKVEP